MKNLQIIVLFSVIMIASSCYTVRTAGNSGKVSPGQAKKASGSKSAKPYAPGQQKKN
ncbi:MAG: quinol oxidase subunit 4 [Pedobacter sp.]